MRSVMLAWFVPPIVVPIFLAVLIAAVVLYQAIG
jgi:hypothetical protein